MTYIAFLRAINVGGHTVKMEQLRNLFTQLGFTNVRSYIQTGNVFFDTDEFDRELLTKKIEQYLSKELGYEVPTCLRTVEEVETVINCDPFKGYELTTDTRHCILFLSTSLDKGLDVPISSPKGDVELIGATQNEAFLIWKIINSRPPANSSFTFIDKLFDGKTTSRFFHTTIKILEAAKKI
jgi:uncharacterized protein (DUF1697 family)